MTCRQTNCAETNAEADGKAQHKARRRSLEVFDPFGRSFPAAAQRRHNGKCKEAKAVHGARRQRDADGSETRRLSFQVRSACHVTLEGSNVIGNPHYQMCQSNRLL